MSSTYNYKNQNNVLASQALANTALTYSKVNSSDLINRANETSIKYKAGVVETTYLVGDAVFAIIRKNYPPEFLPNGEELDHGEGWFNTGDGISPVGLTIAHLAIKTNINPINSVIDKYIGKPCTVTVKDGVALYASVDLGGDYITSFPTKLLRDVAGALGSSLDLFSDSAKKMLEENGFDNESIEQLEKLKYTEEQKGKIVTFKGEAVWTKDSTKLGPNEVMLEAYPIIPGLNQLGMKTKDCHLPTILFSGK